MQGNAKEKQTSVAYSEPWTPKCKNVNKTKRVETFNTLINWMFKYLQWECCGQEPTKVGRKQLDLHVRSTRAKLIFM